MPRTLPSPGTDGSVLIALAPIIAAVMAGFLVIGVALPVLPLHVSDNLGFGTLVVGIVAGSQFAAAVASRVWAGAFADRFGAKRGVTLGLIGAAVSGLLYLASLALVSRPGASVAVLIVGRALLGAAESFIITGGVSWGLALVDKRHAGKVIAWVGTAMFAALALGGPVGTIFFTKYGFASIALTTTLLPLAVFLLLLQMPDSAPIRRSSPSAMGPVVRAVWLPGVGAALSSVGYTAILAFGSLFYVTEQWQPIWLAFAAFAVALILARILCGHLPDKLGGAKIALLFVVVQSAGLAMMWIASNVVLASLGAAISGFGYSLVFPGLGVEAVRTIAPENRGLAMGIYTVFLDVAMALSSPALGWIAQVSSLRGVYLASALTVLLSIGIAIHLLRTPRTS